MRFILACALVISACGEMDPAPSNDPDGSAPRMGQPDATRPDGSVEDAARDATLDVPDARPLPDGFGWVPLNGATIQGACPYNDDDEIRGIEGCAAIVDDWAGGIADTRRNRLVVWGGGHNGYYGNEVYALDLGSQSMLRLNDASPPWPDRDQCSPETADGNAASRHTYDGLAYIEHTDQMFVFGGAPACGPGGITNDTWLFDLETLAWQRMDPTNGGTPGPRPGAVADYDAATELVFLHDNYNFWSYDVDTNTYTLLRAHIDEGMAIDYHLVGRIDPRRRVFVIVGNGEAWTIDISAGSDYALEPFALTNCDQVLNVVYPGMVHDPNVDGMVAWGGGDNVYVLDVDTGVCTAVTSPNGPGPQVQNGTMGRFRYFPDLDVYALVNNWNQDAYVFRPQR